MLLLFIYYYIIVIIIFTNRYCYCNMDNFFDESDESDESDENLLEDEISKHDKIEGLSVRRDALNKSLNGTFRMIFKELACSFIFVSL